MVAAAAVIRSRPTGGRACASSSSDSFGLRTSSAAGPLRPTAIGARAARAPAPRSVRDPGRRHRIRRSATEPVAIGGGQDARDPPRSSSVRHRRSSRCWRSSISLRPRQTARSPRRSASVGQALHLGPMAGPQRLHRLLGRGQQLGRQGGGGGAGPVEPGRHRSATASDGARRSRRRRRAVGPGRRCPRRPPPARRRSVGVHPRGRPASRRSSRAAPGAARCARSGWPRWPARRARQSAKQHEDGGAGGLLQRLQQAPAPPGGPGGRRTPRSPAGAPRGGGAGPGHDPPGVVDVTDGPDRSTSTRSGWIPAEGPATHLALAAPALRAQQCGGEPPHQGR